MSQYYNKLVRDRIPEIIEQSGKKAVTRIAGDGEYRQYLREKLQEEVGEFMENGNPEELADILEVVFALGGSLGVSKDDLLRVMEEKRAQRGGFDKRIILMLLD